MKTFCTYPQQDMNTIRDIRPLVYHSVQVICKIYEYEENSKSVKSVHKPYGVEYTEYDYNYTDKVTYITDYDESGNQVYKFYAWFE